jgi:hypothetical protein
MRVARDRTAAGSATRFRVRRSWALSMAAALAVVGFLAAAQWK